MVSISVFLATKAASAASFAFGLVFWVLWLISGLRIGVFGYAHERFDRQAYPVG
jgi:hypothetical protein